MADYPIYRIRRHPRRKTPIKKFVRVSYGRGIQAGDPCLQTAEDTIQAENAAQEAVLDRYKRGGMLEIVPSKPVPEPEYPGYEVKDEDDGSPD